MRELAPAARGSQDAGSRNLVFTFQLSTVVMPQLWMGFATRIGLGAPCMFRPLIRKAGKVPKEAGLDAGAGDENGGGEVSTATVHKEVHDGDRACSSEILFPVRFGFILS